MMASVQQPAVTQAPARGTAPWFHRVCVRLAALLALGLATAPLRADVIINEIMYAPYEPIGTTNDTEYIELYNPGAAPVDLTSYRFDNGVDFQFAPSTIIGAKGYLVVCRNLNAFTNAYKTVHNVIAGFDGTLANRLGERVTLSKLQGGEWVTVDTIRYVDAGRSDGMGPSLELVNPGFAPLPDQFYGTWKDSIAPSGTPGVVNGVYQPNPPPAAGNILHDPPRPPAGSSVTISVQAGGHSPTLVSGVTLNYRIDARPQVAWRQVAMEDLGVNGDIRAGDGVYTRVLPEYGDPAPTAGMLYEFKMTVTGTNGLSVTVPATNDVGLVAAPYSCLCYFGEDPTFTGEYETFQILMTKENRNLLEYGRAENSRIPIDCTFITSDGRIYYSSGTRYRGNSSLKWPYSFRVELPRGRDLDGSREWDFNYRRAMLQYLGQTVLENAGMGVHGLNPSLAHLWLNETDKTTAAAETPGEFQNIYVRFEPVDNDLLSKHYSGQLGNIYRGENGTYACLVPSTIADYKGWYSITTNNPLTAWTELDALARLLDNNAALYPQILSSLVDVRQWARTYAGHVALSNGEGGFHCPRTTQGDDWYTYRDFNDGRFDMYPWDLDEVIEQGVEGQVATNRSIWGFENNNAGQADEVVAKFLYRAPMISYYVGDVADIVDTVMDPASMSPVFDKMGSILTPAYRQKLEANIASRRHFVHTQINSNLTVSITGATATGPLGWVVASPSIALTGAAPQAYTRYVRINGRTANWNTRNNAWNTTNNLVLPATVNTLIVQAIDSEGLLLKALTNTVVVKAASVNKSGAIAGSQTWNGAGGVVVVTADVTIPAGASLTIASSTVVLFAPSARLLVNGGTLDIQGTATAPVYLAPNDAASAWSIEAVGATSVVTGRQARLVGGRVAVTSGARLAFDSVTLQDYKGASGILTASGAAAVSLFRTIVRDYGFTRFDTTPTTIRHCLLERMTVAGAQFTATTAAVEHTTIGDSLAAGVNGMQSTAGSSVGATGCLLHDLSGRAVTVGGGPSPSALRLTGSLVYNCGTGLQVVAGSSLTNSQTTVALCAVGLQGTLADPHSLIVWDCATPVASGPATVAYSDIQQAGTATYPGTSNLNRPPWFRDTGDGDYQLQAISPCLGSGQGGTDMGSSFPVGANPAAPTDLGAVSTLLGGVPQVVLQWTDTSTDETGFTIERCAAGGAWTVAGSAAEGATGFTDASVLQNTTYIYRVRAVHARGQSHYSEPASCNTGFSAASQDLIANLRLTEIMYNPPNDMQSEEYLEFRNISTTKTLALGGLRFTDGVDFAFSSSTLQSLAPGQTLLLIQNPTAFLARHPGVTYHGVFAGGMKNGSERLAVSDAQSNTIIHVTYQDTWYSTTDGEGYALVLADPPHTPNDPATDNLSNPLLWRPSTNRHGSPGSADPTPPFGFVVINEILAHTDLPQRDSIEVFNAGTNSVNLAGWFLSDDQTDLRKYAVTNVSLVLPPGGYHVFYENTSFNQGSKPFRLSELGETVYLSSGDGVNLTSYRTQEDFDASPNGSSFGRHTRSDDLVDFVLQSNVTLNASNAYPRVGPVVVNEIMYNPYATGKEFIELHNPTSSSAPLYDPAHPANTWRLDGAVAYTFAPGVSMPPQGYLVIASIDPAAFRALYGITNPAVQVVGPFVGALANSGESVKLYRPDVPETNGVIPYIRVDRVQYSDTPPWPTAADNGGASLERVRPLRYGNDPANWIAGSVGGTPGEPNNTNGVPSLGFTLTGASGPETNAAYTVSVDLSHASTSTVTVSYAVAGGTATAGSDYTTVAGTLVFWPYETNHTFALPLLNDSAVEPDETVVLGLSALSPAARFGGNRTFTYTIVDHDATTVAAPVITPAGADFLRSISVTITTTVAQAEVHYTTDGSTPTVGAPIYTGSLVLTGSARIKARAFVGSANAGAVATALFVEKTAPPEDPEGLVNRTVQAGTDDAHEPFNTHVVDVTSSSLTLGYLGRNNPFATGLRFASLPIPPGAIISNAYIQFKAASAGLGALTLRLTGEAVDSAPTFAAVANGISSRTRTAAAVTWQPPNWSTVGEQAAAQRTPDLSLLLQELVNRPGWARSNSVAILIDHVTGNYYRQAVTYDSAPVSAPLLHVEFSVPPNPDADGDYLPDSWEQQHFGSTNAVNGGAGEDFDNDGAPNLDEYVAGTIPTNALSVLAVRHFDWVGLNPVLRWPSVTGRLYAVYRSTNLLQAWPPAPLAGNLPPHTSGTNTYTDTQVTNPPAFYRVGVKRQP